ncbi:MAG: hypothetical protein CM1200mP24_09020 [Gammaproteobacteria bacterium]|nr:MAG: hypothetical protein CM1200mP24_09020 [Gammaproteobacteria bacterium]
MQVLLIDGLNLIRRIHAGVRRLEDLETNSQSVEEPVSILCLGP